MLLYFSGWIKLLLWGGEEHVLVRDKGDFDPKLNSSSCAAAVANNKYICFCYRTEEEEEEHNK